MLEFLGDMGGLIQIVFLFFAGVIYLVVDRNFKAALISDTYKVQKYNRDQSEFYESQRDQQNPSKHIITSESESSQSLSDDSDSSDHKSENKPKPSGKIIKNTSNGLSPAPDRYQS